MGASKPRRTAEVSVRGCTRLHATRVGGYEEMASGKDLGVMHVEERRAIHGQLAHLTKWSGRFRVGWVLETLQADYPAWRLLVSESGSRIARAMHAFLMYITLASEEEMPRPPASFEKISEIFICSF